MPSDGENDDRHDTQKDKVGKALPPTRAGQKPASPTDRPRRDLDPCRAARRLPYRGARRRDRCRRRRACRGREGTAGAASVARSEEHTSELQSRRDLVCRLLLEKKKK